MNDKMISCSEFFYRLRGSNPMKIPQKFTYCELCLASKEIGKNHVLLFTKMYLSLCIFIERNSDTQQRNPGFQHFCEESKNLLVWRLPRFTTLWTIKYFAISSIGTILQDCCTKKDTMSGFGIYCFSFPDWKGIMET